MKHRINRSALLAVVNARQACLHEADLGPKQVEKLLGIIFTTHACFVERTNHIGLVNAAISRIFDEGHDELLPPGLSDMLASLLVRGTDLAVDDTGLGG